MLKIFMYAFMFIPCLYNGTPMLRAHASGAKLMYVRVLLDDYELYIWINNV